MHSEISKKLILSLAMAGLIVGVLPEMALATQESVAEGLNSPVLSNAKAYIDNRLIADEVIVKADQSITKNQMSAHAAGVGGSIAGFVGRRGLFLVKLARGVNQSTAIASLKGSPGVSSAFPNILFSTPEKYQIQRPQKQATTIPHKRPPVIQPRENGPLTRNLTNDPLSGYEWHLPMVRESLSRSLSDFKDQRRSP